MLQDEFRIRPATRRPRLEPVVEQPGALRGGARIAGPRVRQTSRVRAGLTHAGEPAELVGEGSRRQGGPWRSRSPPRTRPRRTGFHGATPATTWLGRPGSQSGSRPKRRRRTSDGWTGRVSTPGTRRRRFDRPDPRPTLVDIVRVRREASRTTPVVGSFPRTDRWDATGRSASEPGLPEPAVEARRGDASGPGQGGPNRGGC